jgi:hypothetical protein
MDEVGGQDFSAYRRRSRQASLIMIIRPRCREPTLELPPPLRKQGDLISLTPLQATETLQPTASPPFLPPRRKGMLVKSHTDRHKPHDTREGREMPSLGANGIGIDAHANCSLLR